MTDHAKTPFKAGLLKGLFDLDAGDDIRVLLCMTNTTVDTEEDIENPADATTLDEMDGANYVRKSFAGEVVNTDTANNRGEFDVTGDTTWTALGAGTRQVAGMLIIKFVTNDTDSLCMVWIDSGGFPFSANGGDFTSQWNAEGIIQAT